VTDTKPARAGDQIPATRTGLALAVIVTGVLISAVDTTIVVLVLPGGFVQTGPAAQAGPPSRKTG
jgi:hypothetical protein